MIKNLKARMLFIIASVILPFPMMAQLELIGNIMAAGPNDAKQLLQPYIAPAANAFGAALGSGWYNTADVHKLGGFDITFTINAAMIPSKYESFVIDEGELTSLRLNDPAQSTSPTIAGSGENGPQIDYNIPGFTGKAFDMPSGLNTRFVPAPMIQAGVGLIKGTEVIGRFMPNIKMSGNEIGYWGLGGKHDIKQWIPGLKKAPVLQLAIMYGYTKLHTNVVMNVRPDDINAGGLPGADASDWDNQQMVMRTRCHTGSLIIGAKLPVVSFYGGLGFISTKTNLKFEGDYPYVGLDVDDVTVIVQPITDPIDMEIKNKDGKVTKPRINAGIRLKMAVVTLHFDYSWANYSVMSAGLGFSFR
jgi:hypothetical protein